MASKGAWRALSSILHRVRRAEGCWRAVHTSPLRGHRLGEPSALIRQLPSTSPSKPKPWAKDFILYENFFTLDETKQLLLMALWKLDRVDSTRRRKRRGNTSHGINAEERPGAQSLQGLFQGEYGFQEGHYDSVIHEYRETLLSTLPPHNPDFADVPALMARMYTLLRGPSESFNYESAEAEQVEDYPPKGSTTHLLHLAPEGVILPHVDNIEASGSMIVGVSLGAERILRLREISQGGDNQGAGWDVRLPNGSLYCQRDSIRYTYEHSILSYADPGSILDGSSLVPGHRISIMIRDATNTASL